MTRKKQTPIEYVASGKWKEYPHIHQQEASKGRMALAKIGIYRIKEILPDDNPSYDATLRAILKTCADELDTTDLIAITELARAFLLCPRDELILDWMKLKQEQSASLAAALEGKHGKAADRALQAWFDANKPGYKVRGL